MRYFFSYRYGYINIDTHNLYLTHSGNWSEIIELDEKPIIISAHKSIWKFLTLLLFAVIILLFLLMISSAFEQQGLALWPLVLLVAAVLAIYKVYHYYRIEMGNRFYIPLEKIQSMEYVEDGIKISFLDKNKNPDSEILQGVSREDFDKMVMLTSKN
jgi:hypothetical protein